MVVYLLLCCCLPLPLNIYLRDVMCYRVTSHRMRAHLNISQFHWIKLKTSVFIVNSKCILLDILLKLKFHDEVSQIYFVPWRQQNIRVTSLNLMRLAARSQWRLASVVLMYAERGKPAKQRWARTADGAENTLECLSKSRCHSLILTTQATVPASVSLKMAATVERFESGEVQWSVRSRKILIGTWTGRR